MFPYNFTSHELAPSRPVDMLMLRMTDCQECLQLLRGTLNALICTWELLENVFAPQIWSSNQSSSLVQ